MRFLPLVAIGLAMATTVQAAPPTSSQQCESKITLASAKFAQCRLTAESKAAKGALVGQKFTDALGKCTTKLSDAYAKALLTHGVDCDVTEPSAAFDVYLTQCSDDTVVAAGGGALPDNVGDLATCNAGTAAVGDVLSGKTFSSSAGLGATGTMANNGAVSITPGTGSQSIAAGYHNGSGSVAGDADLVAGNIASGVNIFGVTGTVTAGSSNNQLLKTGQTTSYGTGTDGNLQLGGARSYVDNLDGTVTDTKTGLMWEKKSDDGSIHDKDNTYTWSTGAPWNNTGTAFTTFLATLNAGGGFAGHTDWRLPNSFELYSIVNLQNVLPAVDSAFNNSCAAACTVTTCSCTVSSYYWSSSTYALSTTIAWTVDFLDGAVTATYKTNGYYVRAVRGGS